MKEEDIRRNLLRAKTVALACAQLTSHEFQDCAFEEVREIARELGKAVTYPNRTGRNMVTRRFITSLVTDVAECFPNDLMKLLPVIRYACSEEVHRVKSFKRT